MSATVPRANTDKRQVLRLLSGLIREEKLTTGQRLPAIRELAALWDMTPHAVRDGVMHAQHLGLVQVRPQAGIFVHTPNLDTVLDSLQDALAATVLAADQDLIDLMEARRLLEAETARLAAKRRRLDDLVPMRQALEVMARTRDRATFIEADDALHLQIARIAGNGVYRVTLQSYLVLLHPFRRNLVLFDTPTFQHTQRTHNAIFEAILHEDPEAARAAMWDSLTHEPEVILSMLTARPHKPRRGSRPARP